MAKTLGPVRCGFAPWNNPEAKPFIQFHNITKRFGDFVAVKDLNLTIFEREFFALLGPSGCGKTTLMRLLAGFEDPSSGTLLLDGKSLSGIPPHKRPANMMFQSYALFPHMSVENNIAFGLKQERLSRSEIATRVSEMLSLVKLEAFAKRKPHQLSGGQRQRVALARSLAKRPKVLLLDEPLGALDKKLREETQFELMDLQEKLGLTFIIVTHDQEEAMTVASRIAVMDHGQLIQVAPPAEIYEAPQSRYVADFIGDINILEGQLASIGKDKIILFCRNIGSGTEIHMPAHHNSIALSIGDRCWFAIRPEKITLSMDKPSFINMNQPANAIEGEVYDIAYLGDISTYHIKIADQQIIRATQTNASRMVERPISWGDKVWLSWKEDAGILLTS